MLGHHVAIEPRLTSFFFPGHVACTREYTGKSLRGVGERKEGKKSEKCVIYVLFQSNFFLTSFRSFGFFPIVGIHRRSNLFPTATFFPGRGSLLGTVQSVVGSGPARSRFTFDDDVTPFRQGCH